MLAVTCNHPRRLLARCGAPTALTAHAHRAPQHWCGPSCLSGMSHPHLAVQHVPQPIAGHHQELVAVVQRQLRHVGHGGDRVAREVPAGQWGLAPVNGARKGGSRPPDVCNALPGTGGG